MLKKARFRDNICGIFLHIRTALCWLCRLRPRGNLLSSLFDIFSGLFQLDPSFLFVMICHLLVRYEIVENCISIYYRFCSRSPNLRHVAALCLTCKKTLSESSIA